LHRFNAVGNVLESERHQTRDTAAQQCETTYSGGKISGLMQHAFFKNLQKLPLIELDAAEVIDWNHRETDFISYHFLITFL
jgi:hypothetical protein